MARNVIMNILGARGPAPTDENIAPLISQPLTAAQLDAAYAPVSGSTNYVSTTNGLTAEIDSFGGIHVYRNGVEL